MNLQHKNQLFTYAFIYLFIGLGVALLGRPEDNLQNMVLFFLAWDLRITLMALNLVADSPMQKLLCQPSFSLLLITDS